MKKSRFSGSQIIAIQKQVKAGIPVPYMPRAWDELGVVLQVAYRFGSMDAMIPQLDDEDIRIDRPETEVVQHSRRGADTSYSI